MCEPTQRQLLCRGALNFLWAVKPLHLIPRCVKYVYHSPAFYGSMLIIQCAHPHLLEKSLVNNTRVAEKVFFMLNEHEYDGEMMP